MFGQRCFFNLLLGCSIFCYFNQQTELYGQNKKKETYSTQKAKGTSDFDKVPFPITFEKQEQTSYKTCTVCIGTGKIDNPEARNRKKLAFSTKTCPVCQGKKKIPGNDITVYFAVFGGKKIQVPSSLYVNRDEMSRETSITPHKRNVVYPVISIVS